MTACECIRTTTWRSRLSTRDKYDGACAYQHSFGAGSTSASAAAYRCQGAEGRDIGYKRDTHGGSDADHAEWLADVSSFANISGGNRPHGGTTARRRRVLAGASVVGGDLLIGIDPSQGVTKRDALPVSVGVYAAPAHGTKSRACPIHRL
jgi:hypothetical protein